MTATSLRLSLIRNISRHCIKRLSFLGSFFEIRRFRLILPNLITDLQAYVIPITASAFFSRCRQATYSWAVYRMLVCSRLCFRPWRCSCTSMSHEFSSCSKQVAFATSSRRLLSKSARRLCLCMYLSRTCVLSAFLSSFSLLAFARN
jgi:hypothetical protein